MQATTLPDPYSEYESLSDEDLHRRFRATGDSLACEVLMNMNRNHFGRLKSEVERRWRGTPIVVNSAEDIVNRALLEVLRKDLDDSGDAFKKLLSVVAFRHACSIFEKWKRKGGYSDVYIDAANRPNIGEHNHRIELKDVSPDPSEIVYSQQLRVAIEDCERCLTERELSVWKVCKERGKTFESIGVILGITSANARVLAVRARQKMERCLKEKGLSPERRVQHVRE